jgi:hypothetical protein
MVQLVSTTISANDIPQEDLMPVTRSELVFLCGGAVAGVLIAKNWDKIKDQLGPLKEKVSPLLDAASEAFGDAYATAARRVGERVEAMQDAMAAAGQSVHTQESNGQTS